MERRERRVRKKYSIMKSNKKKIYTSKKYPIHCNTFLENHESESCV